LSLLLKIDEKAQYVIDFKKQEIQFVKYLIFAANEADNLFSKEIRSYANLSLYFTI
jgi:hypothetical protein